MSDVDPGIPDPSSLPLDELRELRARLQSEEDALSYVRRLVQARLDLVDAERRHRAQHSGAHLAEELPAILARHLTAANSRPPRPAIDASDHPLALALDEICNRLGADDMEELSDDELQALDDELKVFEYERSHERKVLFGRIDALSAELVRRYRDGEARIDGLLDGDEGDEDSAG